MAHGLSYSCPDCLKECRSARGLGKHRNSAHRHFTPASEDEDDNTFQRRYHPLANAPAPPDDGQDPEAWSPFGSRLAFDFAHYHFVELQTSEANINTRTRPWAASVHEFGGNARWASPWKTYRVRYQGLLPPGTPPRWMTQEYELCTRDIRQLLHNQLETTAFKDHVDYVPYRQFNHGGHRVWSNLMSGEWAWKQANLITQDANLHGCMFCPFAAGSDKTRYRSPQDTRNTILYMSLPASLTGLARRAHGNGVLPGAFLAYMTTPDIVCCPDGHFRRVIYGIGPYIADYPEQVWLAGIVQNWCPKCDAHPDHLDDADNAHPRTKTKTDLLITCLDPGILWDDYGIRNDIIPFTHDFPRADIHELLTPDLLHQLIKGTFKDHLVSWVNEYLVLEHGEKRAFEIIQDIDRRLSAVPEFPGLRRFPDGRDFSQWTGDDSKALMKIYIAAIAGYVPSGMVKCLSAFMDFCYLTGVRDDISLPRQHALVHYVPSIKLFGSPNGLCSSITESKHIKAVKEPWRRSSRYKALPQMLRDNEFASARMMTGTTSSYTAMVLAGYQPQVDAAAAASAAAIPLPPTITTTTMGSFLERGYPKFLHALAAHVNHPTLPLLLRQFFMLKSTVPHDGAHYPLWMLVLSLTARITGSPLCHRTFLRSQRSRMVQGACTVSVFGVTQIGNGYARRDTVLADIGGPVMNGPHLRAGAPAPLVRLQ
ncbi:hypothetical protein B0H14DRAFT_3083419 [Mycena olivaceomarginata]|nr:hypothetical protein B0H14DRAFT_3083419 [Mycena olivaceomarginata]